MQSRKAKAEEPFYEIVEDEDEVVEKAVSQGPKPTTMEFVDPSVPIPEAEYNAWREHLKNLLVVKKTKKVVDKKDADEGEDKDEEKKEITLETAAEDLLFADI